MNDSFGPGFRSFALMTAGALAIVVTPALLSWLSGPGMPVMWWTSRAFGLLAYVNAWLSTLFGVLVAAPAVRGAGRGRALTLELHGRFSIATLITTAVHVLLVVADSHSGVSPLSAILPLASSRLTGPVALGTVASWGLVSIAVTTAVYRKLPRWVWRAVHGLSFGTFVLALAHGVTAGTDSDSVVVRGVYVVTSAALLLALARRMSSAPAVKAGAAKQAGSTSTSNSSPERDSSAVHT